MLNDNTIKFTAVSYTHLDVYKRQAVDFPEYPVYAQGDLDAITQVAYNLIDNAVKFCPSGGQLGPVSYTHLFPHSFQKSQSLFKSGPSPFLKSACARHGVFHNNLLVLQQVPVNDIACKLQHLKLYLPIQRVNTAF